MTQHEQRDARGKLRSDYQTKNTERSKTVQSDRHLTEIQEILRNFGVAGMGRNLDFAEATFQDVSQFNDYRDILDHVRLAEESFMALPSKTRELFHHDVAEWLDAANDPDKRALVFGELTDQQAALDQVAAAAEPQPEQPAAPTQPAAE